MDNFKKNSLNLKSHSLSRQIVSFVCILLFWQSVALAQAESINTISQYANIDREAGLIKTDTGITDYITSQGSSCMIYFGNCGEDEWVFYNAGEIYNNSSSPIISYMNGNWEIKMDFNVEHLWEVMPSLNCYRKSVSGVLKAQFTFINIATGDKVNIVKEDSFLDTDTNVFLHNKTLSIVLRTNFPAGYYRLIYFERTASFTAKIWYTVRGSYCGIGRDGYPKSIERTYTKCDLVTFPTIKLGQTLVINPVDTTPDTKHGQNPKDKENSVGEPVNIVTGNMYTTEYDLSLPGRGVPFNFSRTYNSHKNYDGPIGYGWTHSYNIFLEEWQEEGKVKIVQADGRAIYFTSEQDGTFTPPKGEYSTLTQDTCGYVWELKNGMKYSFDLSGNLLSIEDRNSNRLTLTYNETGQLSKVTDTVGREVLFSYNSDKRLAQITDCEGRTVKYEYDGEGNLVKVTDLRGKAAIYAYDSIHNITKFTGPAGNSTYFEYDSLDRCTANYSDNNVLRVDLSYDPDNKRTTITDSKGRQTIKVYNDDGLVTQSTDPDGDTTYYIWDENYNRTQIKDKNGNVTSMAYDSKGNLLTTTDAQGNITTFEYEPEYSFISKITDAKSNVTQYNYDTKGNLISLENALGYKTAYTYDILGELTAAEDARANVTTYKYDSWGNLIETKDALGNITTFSYNPIGKLISTQNAKGSITNYEYDVSSTLITKTTYPDGTYAQFTYDDASRRTSVTDPNANTTTFEYTPNGKVSKTKDALGRTIIYTYDTEENLTSVPDAKGSVTAYTYDIMNRLIEEKNPLGITTTYQYDKVGNKISVTDGNGQTTQYEYDSLNRLSKTIYPGQTAVTYTYDKLGRQTSVEDSRGKIQYKYDKLGRLIEEDGPYDRDTITYEYNELNSRAKMTDHDRGVTAYQYDALNRLIQTTDQRLKTTDYKYDEVGNVTEMVYPNGMKAEYSFDETNRLITLVNKTSANEIISNYSYEYDDAGRKTMVTLPNGQISYTYDNANQLTGENRTSPEAFYAINYTYDPAGNRTQMVKDGITFDYTYNAFNQLLTRTNSNYTGGNNVLIRGQASDENIDKVLVNNIPAVLSNGIFSAKVPLTAGVNTVTAQVFDKAQNVTTKTLPITLDSTAETAYTYDKNGNLIQKSHRGEHTLYNYDYDNMLTSVVYPDGSTTKYTYDANGRRVKQESFSITVDGGPWTVDYLYDGNSVIIERDGAGNTTAAYTRGLSMGGGIGSIISKHEAEKDYYYIYDAQGNVTHLTDSSGKVIIHYEYDAFGNIVYQSGSLENDYQYQTKEFDSQSGLVYFGARYYDPTIGRFTTPDPLGMIDGPNWYVYLDSDSINLIDPWGLCNNQTNASVNTGISAITKAGSAYYGQWKDTVKEYAPGWTKEIDKASNFQSAFQSLGILQGSFTYTDILNKVATGEISQEQAEAAIWIHMEGMSLKATVTKLGSVGGGAVVGYFTGGVGIMWGAIGGAVIIGVPVSMYIDWREKKIFEEIGIQ